MSMCFYLKITFNCEFIGKELKEVETKLIANLLAIIKAVEAI